MDDMVHGPRMVTSVAIEDEGRAQRGREGREGQRRELKESEKGIEENRIEDERKPRN